MNTYEEQKFSMRGEDSISSGVSQKAGEGLSNSLVDGAGCAVSNECNNI